MMPSPNIPPGASDPLSVLDHRPWPLPSGPWVMAQRWDDLLFAHWPVPPDTLRPHVPAGLALETHDGSAWLGLVPFQIRGLRPRFLPPAPYLSSFAEVNVRTYVTLGGKPGVWFFSLDAERLAAVVAARLGFHLPYFWARVTRVHRGGVTRFRSRRAGSGKGLDIEYRPGEPVGPGIPGTLEHFLTERYCLYARRADGALLRAEIHHPPWALRRATATVARAGIAERYGVDAGKPPLLHYAATQDVRFWLPERAGGISSPDRGEIASS